MNDHVPPTVSILVPAFNEATTLRPLLEKLFQHVNGQPYEIILVDDGSTDTTHQILTEFVDHRLRTLVHDRNQGKGAAIRTALAVARGQIVLIQDADLEYDPQDIEALIEPILAGKADVVFGSRFGGPAQRVHLYWHRVANRWLTGFSNLLNNLDLSDMETGYKAFRREVLNQIQIREQGFGVEPELTAKVARLQCRIYEVPISYYGRDYAEGKKIGLRDALWAVWCILRYRFFD